MIFPELAKLMAFEKMRQKDLGDILGISQQSTALKLNGKTDFSRKEMQLIKNHFRKNYPDITMDQIFTEEVEIFLPKRFGNEPKGEYI
jgi:predicted transcriptional regulator